MARVAAPRHHPAAFGLIAGLALVAFGAGPATAGAPVTVNGRVNCVEDADKDDAGRAADEAACIALTDGAVRRDGDKLIIRRPGGEEIAFDSNPAACAADDAEACHVVSLHAYDAARGFALIEEGFYEAMAMNLIDLKTGAKVDVMARPDFSPSGEQLVAVIADLMNEPDYEILIYDLTAAPFRRTFEAKRGTATKFAKKNKDVALFAFAGWDGENRVRLTIVNDEQTQTGGADLVRAKGKWTLKPAGKAK